MPLTREQARQLDRLAIEELGLAGLVLMENAGRNVAAVALDYVEAELQLVPGDARVVILCGGGNNGGDGYVIARHLHNAGAQVTIFSAVDPASLTGDAAANFAVIARMGLEVHPAIHDAAATGTPPTADLDQSLQKATLIIDAVLGTGFTGQVRPPLDQAIEAINAAHGQGVPVLAVDLPSGLDCDSGQPSNATVVANITVTLAAPKIGFLAPQAKDYTGEVILADIGTPPELLARLG